jgi:Trk K+ transport system NAD-binding subunit
VLPAGGDADLLGIATVTFRDRLPSATTALALEEQLGVRVLDALDNGGKPRRLVRGEAITLIGGLRAIEQARAQCEDDIQPVPQDAQTTIIICGLGKVGYRVVKWLAQLEPRPHIVVVTSDETRSNFVAEVERIEGVTLVRGDARDETILRQAGIERASALAAITSDDQTNLQMALEARRICPQIHVVLRVFSDAVATRMTDLFGIHTAYSTSELASATLAAAAAVGGISRAFMAGAMLYGARSMVVAPGDALAGRTLSDLRARAGVLGVWLRRTDASSARLPDLNTTLTPGDAVMLDGPLPALERVRGK